MSSEILRVIGHLMKLPEAAKVSITHGACQRQVKMNCGIHAIEMAVSFAMEGDPSAARFSHELMRNHLRQCFENKSLDIFPIPKAKERITFIQHKGQTIFKIPKLWHKLIGQSSTKPKTAKKFKKV